LETNVDFFYLTLLISSYNMKCLKQNSRENQITHFAFSNIFFFRKSCRLWDNVGKYCRAGQATDGSWSIRISCWITKATNTHSQCVMLIGFPLQQWLQWRAPLLRLYVHYLTCSLLQRRTVINRNEAEAFFIRAVAKLANKWAVLWKNLKICAVHNSLLLE